MTYRSSILNTGFDTETYLIKPPDQMIPSIVCGAMDCAIDGTRFDVRKFHSPECIYDAAGSVDTFLHSTGDGDQLLDQIYSMWSNAFNEKVRIIIQNAAFDVTVCLRFAYDVLSGNRPGNKEKAEHLPMLIWETLEKSMDNEWETTNSNGNIQKPILVSDTIIRDKLYQLSSHGGISTQGADDEGNGGRELRYGLFNIVNRWLKLGLKEGKVQAGPNGTILDENGKDITGTPAAAASYRLIYNTFDMIPTHQWPQGAQDYALQDSTWARVIWEEQEAARKPFGHGSMNSEALQVYCDVGLRLANCTGFVVDQEQVQRVNAKIGQHMQEIEPHMRASGMLRSNGSKNMKLVKEIVEDQWNQVGRSPLLTKNGDIATGAEVLEVLASYSPHLRLYSEYQGLAKIRDAFMPALTEDKVYVGFDVLKETGRTSSFGSGKPQKGRIPLFKAVNGQQLPRKAGIREAFLPPPPDEYAPDGYLILSADYEGMELGSTAQATYNLFGFSVHKDKINAGYNLHTYLGAQLAGFKDPQLVDEWKDPDKRYQAMLHYMTVRVDQEDDSPEANRLRDLKKRAKKFRGLAKPVGLGYPGGLSVDTLCVFAKTVYKVEITPEESAEFRELWLNTYPEMVEYFNWVRNQTDFKNRWVGGRNDGQFKNCYETPGFRRFRAGTTYCATANGAAMQSLSADGAKRSVCWLARACAGGLPTGSPFSILDRCYLLNFIHDENLVAVPNDCMATERSIAVQRLMEAALQINMPDVRVNAEPALSTRWMKAAEPEWNEVEGQTNEAYRKMVAEYGKDVAIAANLQFSSAAPGRDMRLQPWDWHNKVLGLDPEHMLK